MRADRSARALARLRRAAPLAIVLAAAAWAIAPFYRDIHAMGFQDWDVQAAFRYVTVAALRDHHEWPWWNPWLCGGYPAWSFSEAATNLVSPWLPFYLLFSFPVALRLEATGALLVSVLSVYLLTGRFTRSGALRAVVTALWALNGRWALQVSTGHMWHCAYAWSPLVIYFFERAVADARLAWSAAAGAVLALMIYMGGIYPVPHTAFLIGVTAAVMAATYRSWRPLAAAAIMSAVCGGLAAPKLLPVMAQMSSLPRLIASKEKMSVSQAVVMLTAPRQGYGDHPLLKIEVPWVWWEWGMYVGWFGLAVLILGLLAPALPRTWRRALPWQVAGVLATLCAFGAYSNRGPWPLLHKLPVFASQHLPARWLYPAALFLLLAFVAAAAPLWARATERRRWLEPAALVVVALVALNLASVARQVTKAPFRLGVPEVVRSEYFHHRFTAGASYRKPPWDSNKRMRERYDWPSKLSYPAMLANTGVIRCYGVPLDPFRGATARESAAYRGEAFLFEGQGDVRLTGWSPSTADVEVSGAQPGDILVYNMNWDRGWTANGEEAMSWQGTVATRLKDGNTTVHFKFRPQRMGKGLGVLADTILILGAWALVARWRRRR